jgi:nucleoside permease NupC
MLMVTLPYKSSFAGMIGTETALYMTRGQEARNYLKGIVAREDVQTALIAQGINPLEAKARINSLSDAEAIDLADQIEQQPAGGSALGVIVGALLIVFIVLLITDILGYTDIFPFVKKHPKK